MMSYSIPVAVPGYSTRAGRPSTRVLYPGTGYRYRCTGYSCRYSQAYSSSTTRVELSQGFVALLGKFIGKIIEILPISISTKSPKKPGLQRLGGIPPDPPTSLLWKHFSMLAYSSCESCRSSSSTVSLLELSYSTRYPVTGALCCRNTHDPRYVEYPYGLSSSGTW